MTDRAEIAEALDENEQAPYGPVRSASRTPSGEVSAVSAVCGHPRCSGSPARRK